MKKLSFLILILAVLFVFTLTLGKYELSLSDISLILQNNPPDMMSANVFLKIRLPRAFMCVIAGFALSVSGFVYQTIFKNPLVSPDILGVSSGCSIGAITAILYFGSSAAAMFILPFSLGILTVALATALASLMPKSGTFGMILSGIIISALANSIIMVLKYTADPERMLPAIEYWLMGSFSGTLWSEFYKVLPVAVISFTVLFLIRYKIKLLLLGDDEATSLGVNAKAVRITALLFSTLLVSAVVSAAGAVSWVGLIVPHAARAVFGDNYDENFLQSGILGSILLLTADTAARTMFKAELPVSIMTTLIGAFLLLIFLLHRRFSGETKCS